MKGAACGDFILSFFLSFFTFPTKQDVAAAGSSGVSHPAWFGFTSSAELLCHRGRLTHIDKLLKL